MKKFILTLIVSCIATGVFAQKDLTPVQKGFQVSIMNFLREGGYNPSLDEDDWIEFKSEGNTHFIILDSESPFFVAFHISGYTLVGENALERFPAIIACNDINEKYRLVKLYCAEDQVAMRIDSYIRSAEDFKYTFARNISLLRTAKKEFAKRYDFWNEALNKEE